MENVDDIPVNRNRRLFRRRRRRNNGKKTRLVDLMEYLTNEQLKHHTRFSKMSIKQMANTFRKELTHGPLLVWKIPFALPLSSWRLDL